MNQGLSPREVINNSQGFFGFNTHKQGMAMFVASAAASPSGEAAYSEELTRVCNDPGCIG